MYIADDLPSPVAFGQSGICLPANVFEHFSADHRDALVAHELAHLERRDPMWLLAAEAIATLTAFQPLIFVVTRCFRRDVELICDEAALFRTSDRRALIEALALLAAPFDPRAPLSGAATAYDGTPLVARAQRIATVALDARASRKSRVAALAVAAFATLLFAVPVVSAAPRMDDFPADPITGIEQLRAHGRTVLIDSSSTEIQKRTIVLLK